MSDLPAFSIIIPTYNRVDALALTLESIRCQTRRDWELIIIDQSPPPRAGEIEKLGGDIRRTNPRSRYLRLETPSSTAARNVGIREACGEWLIFCDDDVLWPADLLDRLTLRLSQDDRIAMVGGLDFEHPAPRKSRLKRIVGWLSGHGALSQDKGVVLPAMFGKYPDSIEKPLETEWAMGYWFCARRSFLTKHGIWFDENLTRYAYAEDLDFSHRVYQKARQSGLRCMLFPEIGVRHMISLEWRTGSAEHIGAYVWNRYYIACKLHTGAHRWFCIAAILYASLFGAWIMARRGALKTFLHAHLIAAKNWHALKSGDLRPLFKKLHQP